MANHNIERLTEDFKREMCVALREIKDRKVTDNMVTISHLEITSDLSYCKIYISCLGGGGRTKEAVEALTKASGFFKREINARIKMRKMPELIFLPDNSQAYYERINSILESLPETDKEKPAGDDGEKEDQ